ncbi:hypothetical protein F5Y13DRAFT_52580 [Hypoxylon sp. FL1857]|nr:hypothetical protein F5Y13DRAFT_52580 [Hypoxylon sp. FL1857]
MKSDSSATEIPPETLSMLPRVTKELTMTSITESEAPPQHPLSRYKYHLLIGAYLVSTSFFFYRVYRQPFSTAIKSKQYETIFKGTTLAAVVGGVAMSSGGRARYRQYKKEDDSSTTKG